MPSVIATPFDRIYTKLTDRLDVAAAERQASTTTQTGLKCRCGNMMAEAKVMNDRIVAYCAPCRICLPLKAAAK